jgi:hypothetical protein
MLTHGIENFIADTIPPKVPYSACNLLLVDSDLSKLYNLVD